MFLKIFFERTVELISLLIAGDLPLEETVEERGEEKTSWDSLETRPLLEGLCCFGDAWTKGSGRPTFLQER